MGAHLTESSARSCASGGVGFWTATITLVERLGGAGKPLSDREMCELAAEGQRRRLA
jgi:hypothetical protein